MLSLIQNELNNSIKARTFSFILLFFSVFFTIIAGILSMNMIARSISNPIEKVSNRLMELSKGNLQDEVFVTSSNDEVGILTESLETTTKVLRKYIENIAGVLSELDKENMGMTIDFECIGDFEPIKTSLLHTTDTLNHTMLEIKEMSDQLSISSSQLAREHRRSQKAHLTRQSL